ncbi:carbohydrate ABC transporter permease [Cryobacterium sp. Y11]|uniref:carbohydrate ABC transporter permease n=1 Tax=Cryobacterium sp. Y11 TaxID=2045016 RepID=UPI0013049FED|nr:sugar ABC transporter permease [Cryobacterium sp. Y11]
MSSIAQRAVKFSRSKPFMGYVFLLPAILLALLLFVYPIYLVTSISLRDIDVVSLSRLESAPLTQENYVQMIIGADIGTTIWRSVLYMVGVSVPSFLIGLGAALLFNKKFRGNRLLRTLTLIPWAVPGVVAGAAFLWMLDGSYGIINYALASVGLITEYVPWLSRPETALIGVIVPTVWTQFPFYTLVLLASLQNVPVELYEAAGMDGANAFQRFRHITWPAIRSSASLALLLGALTAFREFDLIYSLTRGGPIGATETLAVRIYNEFFVYFDGGVAGAIAILTMIACALGVGVLYPYVKKEFF